MSKEPQTNHFNMLRPPCHVPIPAEESRVRGLRRRCSTAKLHSFFCVDKPYGSYSTGHHHHILPIINKNCSIFGRDSFPRPSKQHTQIAQGQELQNGLRRKWAVAKPVQERPEQQQRNPPRLTRTLLEKSRRNAAAAAERKGARRRPKLETAVIISGRRPRRAARTVSGKACLGAAMPSARDSLRLF